MSKAVVALDSGALVLGTCVKSGKAPPSSTRTGLSNFFVSEKNGKGKRTP